MISSAYIYELNGSIVDTDKYLYECWTWLSEEIGFRLSEKHYLKIRSLDQKEAIDKILKWSMNRISEADKQNYLTELNKRYLAQIDQMSPSEISKGFTFFNNSIRNGNTKVAAISIGTNAIRIIDRLELVLDFDAIVDSSMVDKVAYTSLLELSCEKMQLSADHCVFISSSVEALDAAKSLGMKTMAFGKYANSFDADMNIASWDAASSLALNETS